MEEVKKSITMDYDSQAEKYLRKELRGKSRVWSDAGCWLYPGDAVIEATEEDIKLINESLNGKATEEFREDLKALVEACKPFTDSRSYVGKQDSDRLAQALTRMERWL